MKRFSLLLFTISLFAPEIALGKGLIAHRTASPRARAAQTKRTPWRGNANPTRLRGSIVRAEDVPDEFIPDPRNPVVPVRPTPASSPPSRPSPPPSVPSTPNYTPNETDRPDDIW
jgi:hypothetical protein